MYHRPAAETGARRFLQATILARLERFPEVRDTASRYDEITVLLGIEADYVLWGHTAGPVVSDVSGLALDAIAASGAALELNTDQISDPAGVMYPSDELLRAARDRDIQLVISSDAHAAKDVGRLWNEAMARAVRAGFRGAVRLSDRRVVPLPEGPSRWPAATATATRRPRSARAHTR